LAKILLTGANGLLGQKTAQIFAAETTHELILTDIQPIAADPHDYEYFPMDITKKEDVKSSVRKYAPSIIINIAAYTNVDGCETEKELSWRVNVDAVKHFIIASRINTSKIIHISTDYVFDGKYGNYDENSKPNPISYYGKGKLASENALITSGVPHAIIRPMIIYGTGKNLRLNFALWLIEKLKNSEPVNIVDDQFGQPTIVDDIALGILRIVDRDKFGIYHICGSEYVSRFDFAVKLAEVFSFDKKLINPVKTSDLQQAAPRPMHSSFILLKAETELGIKPLNVMEGLYFLKSQLGS
jgi:dTDP-4-dehydrorhamnose reductase